MRCFRQEGGDQNGSYFIKTASIFPEQSAKPQSCLVIPRWRSPTSTLNCITDANGRDMALVTSTKPENLVEDPYTDTIHIVSMNDQGELQYKEMACVPPCAQVETDYTFCQQVITEQAATNPTHRLLFSQAYKPWIFDTSDWKFKLF